MAGEPKTVEQLLEAVYKDNLMIPVSDPDIPAGPSKDSFRLDLGNIPGKGVNSDWNVAPAPSIVLAMTDLHNATFTSGVLASDFTGVAGGGFAIGVGKTNLNMNALTVGQTRAIAAELVTVPPGPATQIVGVAFAPSTLTAAQVAAVVLDLFMEQPVAAPFIFQYAGIAGPGFNIGAMITLANDANPSGATQNLSFGSSNPLIAQKAAGDRSFVLMSRQHVTTPTEEDQATFALGFHDVSTGAYEISNDALVDQNPVIPAGMTAFFIVATVDSGGYAPTSVRPNVIDVMPGFNVTGTEYGAAGTQMEWDASFPTAPTALVTLTQPTFPVGAKKGLVYRAVNATPTQATPYGVAIADGEYAFVNNVTSGQEHFTVLAPKAALSALSAAIANANADIASGVRQEDDVVFYVKDAAATTPLVGANVFDTFHAAYLAAAAMWDAQRKVIVIDDSTTALTINEPVEGYQYQLTAKNIWLAGLSQWNRKGVTDLTGLPQSITWAARTDGLRLQDIYLNVGLNSFNSGFSIADGYLISTFGGNVPPILGGDNVALAIQDGALNYANGFTILLGDNANFFANTITGGTISTNIYLGHGALFQVNVFSYASATLNLTLARDYTTLTPPTTGANGGQYVLVNYSTDGGLQAFRSEILNSAPANRDVYYVGDSTLVLTPAPAASYTAFDDAVTAALAIRTAIGGVVTIHIADIVATGAAGYNFAGKDFTNIHFKGRPELAGGKPAFYACNNGAAATAVGAIFEDVILSLAAGGSNKLMNNAGLFINCEFYQRTTELAGSWSVFSENANNYTIRLMGSAKFDLANSGVAFDTNNGTVIDDTTDGIVVTSYGPFVYYVAKDSSVTTTYPIVYSNFEVLGSTRWVNSTNTAVGAIQPRGTWQRGVTTPDYTATFNALKQRDGDYRGNLNHAHFDWTSNVDVNYNGGYICYGNVEVTLPNDTPNEKIVSLTFYRDKGYDSQGFRATGPWLKLNGAAGGGNGLQAPASPSTGSLYPTISFYYADVVVAWRSGGSAGQWSYVAIGEDQRPASAMSEWATPTLSNSWTTSAGQAALRYKMSGRELVFDGSTEDGTAGLLFTLPVGFRPDTKKIFAIAAQDSVDAYITAYIEVLTTGDVTLVSPSPSSHRLHFNGQRFALT